MWQYQYHTDRWGGQPLSSCTSTINRMDPNPSGRTLGWLCLTNGRVPWHRDHKTRQFVSLKVVARYVYIIGHH
eukprot:m.438381 g.438381  ORF g.438381 m.438381 type:complete len:73 (+) comp113905_c0_seq1:335-553(+)